MKKTLHPTSKVVKFICSCWNIMENKSTLKEDEYRVEICYKCHPYYTWEQKILKTWAVDKFYSRLKKTQDIKK